MQNYSLYQPSELQDKLYKFEQIKRNRFKKGPKSQKSAVIEETGPVTAQRRTEAGVQRGGKGGLGQYYSNREKGDRRVVSSVKDSIKRGFSMEEEDSKGALEGLKNKEFYEMNSKDMKMIFSLLDYKKMGFVSKDNFDLNKLPSHLIKKMKGLIIKVISSNRQIDFDEFLQLIYS